MFCPAFLRMVVRVGHKRTPGELVGAEVFVLSQEPGGWTQCRRCDTDAIVRVHSKCLAAIPGNIYRNNLDNTIIHDWDSQYLKDNFLGSVCIQHIQV